jgi:hypothetical protein
MTPISTATAVLVMMAVVVAVLSAAANAQAPASAPATSDGQLSDPFFHRCFFFSLVACFILFFGRNSRCRQFVVEGMHYAATLFASKNTDNPHFVCLHS